jgi:stage IV sporulation protein B
VRERRRSRWATKNKNPANHGVNKGSHRRWWGVALAGLSLAAMATVPVRALASLPGQLTVPRRQEVAIGWSRLLPLTVSASRGISWRAAPSAGMVGGRRLGWSSIRLNLFGWIPVDRIPVRVVPAVDVVPGGQSIGVVVHTDGVMVTGYDPIRTLRGWIDPAEAAGIEPGDVIVAADGRGLRDDAALAAVVQAAGRRRSPVTLTVQGARRALPRIVWPVFNAAAGRYQLGIVVRDTASGVGTLTFWNPRTLAFRALGHSITDGLTRNPVAVAGGQITSAVIVGVVASTPDHPGEKIGVLAGTQTIGGVVNANDRFGLAGRLDAPPSVGSARPVPVAMADQVRPGPAEILTVIAGQRPQAFRIRILATYPQARPATKGLLFEVTDPRLLAKTGGIVQGMSGSPILQDGRLVGAVTHVFVNRPDAGYGCYAEWMLAR